jgi:hypothetical protein
MRSIVETLAKYFGCDSMKRGIEFVEHDLNSLRMHIEYIHTYIHTYIYSISAVIP